MFNGTFAVFNRLPPELITIIVAALPVSELRGAIPLGLLTFHHSILKVIFLAIVGNLIPVVPLLLFLQPLSEKLHRFKLWRKFFDRIFIRTKNKAQLIQRYEALGLVLFVAIPLPATGAWSGCVAASLFKVKFRYAVLAITIGVCLAAAVVTTVTLIGQGIFFNLFLAR